MNFLIYEFIIMSYSQPNIHKGFGCFFYFLQNEATNKMPVIWSFILFELYTIIFCMIR